MMNEQKANGLVEPFGLPFSSLPKNIPIFPLSGAFSCFSRGQLSCDPALSVLARANLDRFCLRQDLEWL